MSRVNRVRGHSSANAHRAPNDTRDDDPVRALHRRLDYFPTAPWAGRAVGAFIRSIDPDAFLVDEPACGEGHLAHGLSDHFTVRCSDIHAFGYGEVHDFFAPWPDGRERPDWIITNPPFEPAVAFLQLALRRARRGVAMILRLAFIESIGRHDLLFGQAGGLTFKVVFSERVPMVLGRWHPDESSAAAYALFVFVKSPLAARWPDAPLLRAFAPGTKAAMSRPSDLAFAKLPAPERRAA